MKRRKVVTALTALWPLARILLFGLLGYYIAKFLRPVEAAETEALLSSINTVSWIWILLSVIAVGAVGLLACSIILARLRRKARKLEGEWDQLMRLMREVKDAEIEDRGRVLMSALELRRFYVHTRPGPDTDPPATRP